MIDWPLLYDNHGILLHAHIGGLQRWMSMAKKERTGYMSPEMYAP
jgi:hypothetical protein